MANTLAYKSSVLSTPISGYIVLGPYSQHFTFFTTYEWAQLARVLHYTRMERISRGKRSSLSGAFISYEESGPSTVKPDM
jgi:hypothetical protein